MARQPRLYFEDCPQHVIQRGNNRNVCFYNEADYAFYLKKLKETSRAYDVEIHAYVLMTNHVHLLATPRGFDSLPRMMQMLGTNYVRFINTVYKRTGTLWEGRYKASLVDSENYFLTLSKYIELNPVRAGMVSHPGEYLWSSYRANGMGVNISLLTAHFQYLALGSDKAKRVLAYRAFVEKGLIQSDVEDITRSTAKQWVIGSERFRR